MSPVRIGATFLDFGGNVCRVIAFRSRVPDQCVVVRHGSRPGRKRFWPIAKVARRMG